VRPFDRFGLAYSAKGRVLVQTAREVKGDLYMSEENKALVQRSWEISNPENLDEVYPPDVVWHMPEQDLSGIEEAKQYASTFFEAFPDVSFSVEDILADGDKVVSRIRFRGTHQGETEEFGPPTGRQLEQEGITIHRIEGGKIVEEWNQFDNLSILQQLGLAPEQ
jgi:predicted ester cyclase